MIDDELDISSDELAVALADVPTGAFPPDALIPKEKMLSIFGTELDINAFESLGDLASLGVNLSNSDQNAFRDMGEGINSRIRELVLPK